MNDLAPIPLSPRRGHWLAMGDPRRSTFARWAAERARVAPEHLTIDDVAGIPRRRDLPDGPPSDTGGYVADHKSVTESEMDDLAALGDEVIKDFGRRPGRPRS